MGTTVVRLKASRALLSNNRIVYTCTMYYLVLIAIIAMANLASPTSAASVDGGMNESSGALAKLGGADCQPDQVDCGDFCCSSEYPRCCAQLIGGLVFDT